MILNLPDAIFMYHVSHRHITIVPRKRTWWAGGCPEPNAVRYYASWSDHQLRFITHAEYAGSSQHPSSEDLPWEQGLALQPPNYGRVFLRSKGRNIYSVCGQVSWLIADSSRVKKGLNIPGRIQGYLSTRSSLSKRLSHRIAQFENPTFWHAGHRSPTSWYI